MLCISRFFARRASYSVHLFFFDHLAGTLSTHTRHMVPSSTSSLFVLRACIPHTPHTLYPLMYTTLVDGHEWLLHNSRRTSELFCIEGFDEIYDGMATLCERGRRTQALEEFNSVLYPSYTVPPCRSMKHNYLLQKPPTIRRFSRNAVTSWSLLLQRNGIWANTCMSCIPAFARQTFCTFCRAIGSARYGLSQSRTSMAGRRGHVICTRGREFGYACNHREQNRHLLNES